MKAVIMQAVGEPDVLVYADWETPDIKSPTDVRVKLYAAGVNPIDAKLRGGFYPMEPLPAILGCDGAGVIESVGDAVKNFKPGDEVYFFHGGIAPIPGNYAEYIVLDERFIALKPASLDFHQAAAAPLVLLTAWEALFDRARLNTGQTVLIHAGAGGVGHVAIQLAKHVGASVCTTVSSKEKAALVSRLGADTIINYKETDFVKAVLEWTKGKGVDVAMDNVGGPLIQQTFPGIAHYGDMVTLLQPDNNVDWSVARQRNLRFSMEIMLTPLLFGLEEAQRHQTWILEECAKIIDAGKLSIEVNTVLPLAKAVQAHQMIETGSTTGKIVLSISE